MYLKLLAGSDFREVAEAKIQKQLIGGTRGDSGLDGREWLGGLARRRLLDLLRPGVSKWGKECRTWAWAAQLCGIWSLQKLGGLATPINWDVLMDLPIRMHALGLCVIFYLIPTLM